VPGRSRWPDKRLPREGPGRARTVFDLRVRQQLVLSVQDGRVPRLFTDAQWEVKRKGFAAGIAMAAIALWIGGIAIGDQPPAERADAWRWFWIPAVLVAIPVSVFVWRGAPKPVIRDPAGEKKMKERLRAVMPGIVGLSALLAVRGPDSAFWLVMGTTFGASAVAVVVGAVSLTVAAWRVRRAPSDESSNADR